MKHLTALLEHTCRIRKQPLELVKSRSRKRELVITRMIYTHIAVELFHLRTSYSQIASEINRHHATTIHSVKALTNDMLVDKRLTEERDYIRDEFLRIYYKGVIGNHKENGVIFLEKYFKAQNNGAQNNKNPYLIAIAKTLYDLTDKEVALSFSIPEQEVNLIFCSFVRDMVDSHNKRDRYNKHVKAIKEKTQV